jgi:hypothetical protein
MMKKLFLVLLVLLVGMTGLSASPPQPGGADDAPQVIMPLTDSPVSIAVPGMPAPMWRGGVFVSQDIELICLWADQYREGLLTGDEFKTLVSGRITIMDMRDQVGSMRSLAVLTV